MNNEEKILSMLVGMQSDIATIKSDISAMQEDIDQIKEDTEITRGATNSLIEWAENVSIITAVKFPVEKKAQ